MSKALRRIKAAYSVLRYGHTAIVTFDGHTITGGAIRVTGPGHVTFRGAGPSTETMLRLTGTGDPDLARDVARYAR